VNGTAVLKLASHSIPAALNLKEDYDRINCVLRKSAASSYFYYINAYSLEYVACGIWDGPGFAGSVIAGPFISEIADTDFITGIIYKNSLPISERRRLQEFYESLAITGVSYSNDIAAMMVNLFSHPYIAPRLSADTERAPVITRRALKTDAAESKSVINTRYRFEKEMMNAISKGDKTRTEQLLDENDSMMSLPGRAESSIRSLKNISFVLNTLCRIAAERGGVQPVYLHNISEKFAIMIERASNLPYLKELSHLMVDEYCSLVRAVSSSGCSPIVKKAADYIDLNIESQLRIKDIADEVHVNASHLSRKFRSDTGMTIVDYINLRRVEEAKIYLEIGYSSIADVALMVGYNDLNYFGRVFKKITGLTPSQYIKSRAGNMTSDVFSSCSLV
jgi:two-component system, response regulator YesN